MKIKRIKDEAFACLIIIVEPATNENGNKRFSLPVSKPSTEKKPRLLKSLPVSKPSTEAGFFCC